MKQSVARGLPTGTKIQVDAHEGDATIDFGRAFEIRVLRSWPRGQDAPPFDAGLLAPLRVREIDVSRRVIGARVEETRRYRAWAFSVASIEIGERKLVVRSALADQHDPKQVELPFGAEPEARALSPWLIGGLVGAAVSATVLGLWLRRRAVAQASARDRDAALIALRRLAELREVKTHGDASPGATGEGGVSAASRETGERARADFHVAVARAVRDFVQARYGVRAPSMTSEEFLAAPSTAEVIEAAQRPRLRDFLVACDRVKYARAASDRDSRSELLDSAERFVRAQEASA